MRLLFKIDFFNTNFYYVDILNKIIDDFGINAKANLYNKFIIIDCDDTNEKIEGFFKTLEQKLPISIFVGDSGLIESLGDDVTPLIDKNIKVDISYTNDEIIDILQNSSDTQFESEITVLEDGKILEFGDNFLSTNYDSLKDEKEISVLMTNMSAVAEIFTLNQKQIQLLSSIERPFVKLEINFNKNMNSEFGKYSSIYVRFAKTKDEIIFSNELRKSGIDYLFISAKSVEKTLKATYSENQNIIISGEDSIFPKYDYTLEKRFESLDDYLNECGGIYKATLAEYNKRVTPSIGIHFSTNSKNSEIAINVPGIGKKSVIVIPNIYLDLNHCLEEISEIDENTQRLIENYKKRFPNLLNNSKIQESNGFGSIINLISRLLGIESVEEFEDVAKKANLKSGIQIDMKIVKIDNINYLDYRRVVQSILSYKMADVANSMLVFSFYESLSDLISDNVAKIESELKSKDVVLTGDMFANKILFDKVKKALKNYNILIPRSLPID